MEHRVVTIRRTDPSVKGAYEYAKVEGEYFVVEDILNSLDTLKMWEVYLDNTK